MEENGTLERKDEKKDERAKKPDPKQKTLGRSFSEWWKGCVGEYRKIVWPSRPELVKKTFTVIVVSLFIGAVIVGMDTVFNAGLTGIVGLLSK